MRRVSTSIALAMTAILCWAQGPNDTGTYYKNANGKKGAELKTALYGIITNNLHCTSYDGLIDAYRKTDTRPDGYVRDWYSNTTNFRHDKDKAGSYKKEGDVYNREHLVPQSWGAPKSDVVHVVPTDGYVNNRRGNYPLGETSSPTYKSNNGYSKLGPCSVSGYTGTVFEPNDEVKGDIARIYFYMATCYENSVKSWGNDFFASNKYPAFEDWSLQMLMRWAALDPIDSVEWARNNAVQEVQNNRNPFVDYPGLEDYVWGDKKDIAFNYEEFEEVGWKKDIPDPDPDPDPDPTPDPEIDPEIDPDGDYIYNKVWDMADVTIGDGYLIVCETAKGGAQALSGFISNSTKALAGVSVTVSGDKISTGINADGKPHELRLGGSEGAYTFYDTCDKTYIGLTSNSNALNHVDNVTDGGTNWNITFSGEELTILNTTYQDRSIRYNNSSPRFACYTSGQESVALYKRTVTTSIEGAMFLQQPTVINIYSIDGRLVRSKVPAHEALSGLDKGIYIIRSAEGRLQNKNSNKVVIK